MGYFNNTIDQVFVATTTSGFTTSGGTISLASSGAPAALTAGQIGFFTTNQWGGWTTATLTPSTSDVTLGYGSFNTVAGIGPDYFGLKDPIMSHQIKWANVTNFQYKKGHPLNNQDVAFGWDTVTTSGAGAVGPVFYCGLDYTLQLNYTGDAVFAALNKEGYSNLQANGGCCPSACTSGCTGTAVDAAYVLLQWKDRISQNPLILPFIAPHVFVLSGGTAVEVYDAYDNSLNSALPIYVPNTSNPASVVAGFRVNVIYVGAAPFGATWDPHDRYEYSPCWITGSLYQANGNQCAWTTTINSTVPNMFADITTALTGNPMGPWVQSGAGVLRDFIVSLYYRQRMFANSLTSTDVMRAREIENSDVILNIINQTGVYDQVVITFNSVDISNQSPTSPHSRQQYHEIINVIHGTDVTALTTYISGCLAAVGNNVVLDTIN